SGEGGVLDGEVGFSMEIAATPSATAPFVTFADATPDDPLVKLDSLTINALVIPIGDIMILRAEGVSVDFNAPPDDRQFHLDHVQVTFPRYPSLPAAEMNGVDVYAHRIEIGSATIVVNGHIGNNPRLLALHHFKATLTNIGVDLDSGAILPVGGLAGSIRVSGGATLLPEEGPSGIGSVVNLNGAWLTNGDIVFESGTLVLPLFGDDEGVRL